MPILFHVMPKNALHRGLIALSCLSNIQMGTTHPRKYCEVRMGFSSSSAFLLGLQNISFWLDIFWLLEDHLQLNKEKANLYSSGNFAPSTEKWLHHQNQHTPGIQEPKEQQVFAICQSSDFKKVGCSAAGPSCRTQY